MAVTKTVQMTAETVHRPDGTISLLNNDDSLDGEEAVPGFTMPVSDLWE